MTRPLDGTRHQLREEADEGGKTQQAPLAMDFAEVEINRVTQRLEGEKRDARGQQIHEAQGHEGRRIGQLQGKMDPGKHRVQVLNHEPGVLEKEQQG